jgi:spoIIIJ-associated protein
MSNDSHAKLTQFLKDVTGAMGLSLDVSVDASGDNLRVDLTGPGAELLLRRKGEALDALQHIVNTAFKRDAGDQHLIVDCLGYRKGKEAELKQMTQFLIEKARSSGEPQELGPLNPFNRRLVHLAVAEHADMASESIGDAFMKTVVISRKK